jgi:hypothetical protein
VLRPLGVEPQPEWTAGLLILALAAAAQTAGKKPEELTVCITAKIAADVNNLAELIASREGEERELVGRMLADRARAAAAAVYSDEQAAATVAKVERHLGRELERTLHMLQQLQAARLERGERVGEVLEGVLELGVQRDVVVAALAEARGSGPPLSLVPTAREMQPDGDGSSPAGG